MALLAGYLHNRQAARQGIDPAAEKPVIPDGECCGQHEVCEKDSLLAAVSKQIEYYDDEELNRFAMQGLCRLDEWTLKLTPDIQRLLAVAKDFFD